MLIINTRLTVLDVAGGLYEIVKVWNSWSLIILTAGQWACQLPKSHCTESFFSVVLQRNVSNGKLRMREESSHDIRSSVDNFPHIVFWHSLFTFLTYYAITVVIKKNWSLYLYCFFWECCFAGELISLIFYDCSCCIPWLRYVIHTY